MISIQNSFSTPYHLQQSIQKFNENSEKLARMDDNTDLTSVATNNLSLSKEIAVQVKTVKAQDEMLGTLINLMA